MTDWWDLVLSALGSWILGGIPFSLLIARWAGGIDLRQHGSRNVGATNVARTLGAKWGVFALLCDALKGAGPLLLFPAVCPVADPWRTHQLVFSGVAAVVGHMFSPWLGFGGGKGVATALGVACVLAPWSTLTAFVAFVLTMGIWRIVSLSSMCAALTFAVTQIVSSGAALWTAANWSLGVFSVAVPTLIVLRHRANLVRLWNGNEPRLVLGQKPVQGEPPAPAAATDESAP